jgi:hypothetical protein
MKHDYEAALKAYVDWLNETTHSFTFNGQDISVDGEKRFYKRSDCQKLADHGEVIRHALQMMQKLQQAEKDIEG